MLKWYLVAASEVLVLGWLCSFVRGAATESPEGQPGNGTYGNSTQVSGGDLPGLARAAAVAKFDLQVAQDQLRRAEEGFPSREKLFKQYQTSPEYQGALQNQREAQQAYTAQRQAMLKKLTDNPEYRDALAKRDDMQRRLDYVRRVASIDTRSYLAQRKLYYATAASRIRIKAQQADPDFQKSDQRLTEAKQRVRQLQDQFEEYYRNDPAVAAAMDRLERANEAYLKAMREQAGTDAAYGQALESQGVYADSVRRYRYANYPW